MAAAAARAAAAEDADIAKTRVITQVASIGRGGPPAKNLATRWIALVEAATSGTQAATEEAYQRFMVALDDMQLLGRKLEVTQAVSRRELESYEAKKTELAANIAQAQALIEQKKGELAAAQEWRQQQEEYELLRKRIVSVPPRHETQALIDDVNASIRQLRANKARQDAAYEVIAKKCAAVQYQLEDLLASFPGNGGAADTGGGERDATGGGAVPMQVDG